MIVLTNVLRLFSGCKINILLFSVNPPLTLFNLNLFKTPVARFSLAGLRPIDLKNLITLTPEARRSSC